jgi:uncharacterized membrane protein
MNNPANLLIAGLYYLIVAILAFFALFGVYVLIRYSQSKTLALTVSVVFGFFFLTILANSYRILNNII